MFNPTSNPLKAAMMTQQLFIHMMSIYHAGNAAVFDPLKLDEDDSLQWDDITEEMHQRSFKTLMCYKAAIEAFHEAVSQAAEEGDSGCKELLAMFEKLAQKTAEVSDIVKEETIN